jgi:prepilin-type N-terminal cleavage/methylation domain-containing protein
VKTCSRKRPEFGVVPLKTDVLRRLVAPQLNRWKSLREDRLTLLKLRRRSCAFTLPELREHHCAFTLLELLVVMAIIVLLLAMVVPAVTSLSKSNGRKAAIANLLGGIEQARAQAIADGQATYVVFATFGSGTSQAILDRYNFKSYAIFEDDPANPGAVKQLTPWRILPTGVSLLSESLGALATSTFTFTPLTATATFPFLKFTSDGGVDPASTPLSSTGSVPFGIFEGYVNGSIDNYTSTNKFTETITVGRFTGRAEDTTP